MRCGRPCARTRVCCAYVRCVCACAQCARVLSATVLLFLRRGRCVDSRRRGFVDARMRGCVGVLGRVRARGFPGTADGRRRTSGPVPHRPSRPNRRSSQPWEGGGGCGGKGGGRRGLTRQVLRRPDDSRSVAPGRQVALLCCCCCGALSCGRSAGGPESLSAAKKPACAVVAPTRARWWRVNARAMHDAPLAQTVCTQDEGGRS